MSGDGKSAVIRPEELVNHAIHLREEGEVSLAGEFYIAAAHSCISFRRRLPEERSPMMKEDANSPMYIAWGVQNILAASLCYRISGANSRAQRYCKIGMDIVEDVAAHEPQFESTPARLGLANEWFGDLRLFGKIEGYEEFYEEATAYYEQTASPEGWNSEPEFDKTIMVLFALDGSIENPVVAESNLSPSYKSLVDRIRAKQKYYPEIIEKVVEQGTWESDYF